MYKFISQTFIKSSKLIEYKLNNFSKPILGLNLIVIIPPNSFISVSDPP